MEEITLEWFFKMPGILILGGVVLIILAIVIFIIGGVKSKNDNEIKETLENPVNVSPVKIENNSLKMNSQENNEVLKSVPNVEIAKDESVQNVINPVVEPVVNNIPDLVKPVATPISEPIITNTSDKIESTAPIINEPPVNPIIEPTVNMMPSLEQTINTNETSKISMDDVQMIIPSPNEETEEII